MLHTTSYHFLLFQFSFIKGSVAALQINEDIDRSLPHKRFLNLDGYLALRKLYLCVWLYIFHMIADQLLPPARKQSRMDESQRREVYDLYLSYEKVKRDGHYYDECDLVYSIAGRISLVDNEKFENMKKLGVLPIDSLFVDEVQDFTQAELYVLAKLCRDPNNLFLAGDTAQSIALGVDFRFTDVRQIFYNSFGGIEPRLLQLTHNYRSHAGVLRVNSFTDYFMHKMCSFMCSFPPLFSS